MASTAEPPEHRACRTQTTTERRGVEAALDEWRLGDSNWRNLYVGNRHVGVIWEPGLPARVVAAMNHGCGTEPAERHAEPRSRPPDGSVGDAASETESGGAEAAEPREGSAVPRTSPELIQIHLWTN